MTLANSPRAEQYFRRQAKATALDAAETLCKVRDAVDALRDLLTNALLDTNAGVLADMLAEIGDPDEITSWHDRLSGAINRAEREADDNG